MRYLSNDFYNYQNCFNLKNIEILFEYNNIDYAIDLFFEIELLYSLLYALFKKKLYILQKHFLKNLVSKCVCKSINNASVSIFFNNNFYIKKRQVSLSLYKLSKSKYYYNKKLIFVVFY